MKGVATAGHVGLLLAGLLVAGCDGGQADPTIAKALETKSEMEVAAAAMADKKHEQAQAAKAAAEAEAAARKAELTAAAKLPTTLPATLEKACDAFVSTYDAFMLAGEEKEVLQWWDGHRKKLGEARSKCMVRESIEVAACSTEAMSAELPTLDALPRADAAVAVVEACIAAHGKDA